MLQSLNPCAEAGYLNIILNALNIALATWLVHRRLAADRRENGVRPAKLDQRTIDGKRRNESRGPGDNDDGP